MSVGEGPKNQIKLPETPPPGAEFQLFAAVVHAASLHWGAGL
jgi:hypothetical protein